MSNIFELPGREGEHPEIGQQPPQLQPQLKPQLQRHQPQLQQQPQLNDDTIITRQVL